MMAEGKSQMFPAQPSGAVIAEGRTSRLDLDRQEHPDVSKYPPTLTYAALELGILFLCLAFLRTIEPKIGVRENGPFFVFGQTAMFFYLVHRLAFEIPATYFGLRSVGGLGTTGRSDS